jgi:hypothetical protein
MKKNGLQKKKIFKLKTLYLKPNQIVNIKKSYSFKPITTRVYYEGKQTLAILINGQAIKSIDFVLKNKDSI